MKTLFRLRSMFILLLLCAGEYLYGAAEGSGISAVTVGYADPAGVPVVKVVIAGKEYAFVFDTGAQKTCISDRIVEEGKLVLRTTGDYVVGMEGNISYAVIPSLTIGGAETGEVEAVVLPRDNASLQMLGVDGIVGADVLANRVVTFDARTKTIRIAEGVAAEEGVWEPMKLWDGLPLLNLKLSGNGEVYDVPGLFDSGSNLAAFGLPSVEGFGQWTAAGIIGDTVGGRGTTTLMLGGRVGTEKLYRGSLTECHIGDGVFRNIPVYTGGMGYLLLCFKLTDLGRLTLDYPNRRFRFTAYEDASVWEGDRRPVMTAVVNGKLVVTTVWGKACEKLVPGDVVTALDGWPTGNVPNGLPNIDEFIGLVRAKTVTVRAADGNEQTLTAALFLKE